MHTDFKTALDMIPRCYEKNFQWKFNNIFLVNSNKPHELIVAITILVTIIATLNIAVVIHVDYTLKKRNKLINNWSERSACAAHGCWHKRRWPLFLVFFPLVLVLSLLAFTPERIVLGFWFLLRARVTLSAQEAGRPQTELTNHSPGSSAYTWPCGLRLPNQLCARIS